MMMFELRIDIFDNSNIIKSIYCEPGILEACFPLNSQHFNLLYIIIVRYSLPVVPVGGPP